MVICADQMSLNEAWGIILDDEADFDLTLQSIRKRFSVDKTEIENDPDDGRRIWIEGKGVRRYLRDDEIIDLAEWFVDSGDYS